MGRAIDECAARSASLTGDGGGHLEARDGPMDVLLPNTAVFHHCDAHCGSLSAHRARSVVDMAKKLATCAKFLHQGDNAAKVRVHTRRLLGFDPIPPDMEPLYQPRQG